MRIGLCACYQNRNYGSMLQAYANFLAIEKLGHKCELIRYTKRYTMLDYMRQSFRLFNPAAIQRIKEIIRNKLLAKKYPEIEEKRKIRDAKFDSFCSRVFTSVSPIFVGYKELQTGSERYDAVMVGSDQMWLPLGLPSNFYNLQFVAPGIRRISYATSFGVSKIPWFQTRRTADYLKKIDYLSVREQRGKDICEDIAGEEAELVVDPTLLFSREEWDEILPFHPYGDKPYIFCYFLGNRVFCREEAIKVSLATGLPIVCLKHLDEIVPEDEVFGDMALYDVDPGDFVNLIRGAAYVLTDSFHGTVFSLLNEKSFVSFLRHDESFRQNSNSRIESILGQLSLLDRIARTPGESEEILNNEIRYIDVGSKLTDMRETSKIFLSQAMNKDEELH